MAVAMVCAALLEVTVNIGADVLAEMVSRINGIRGRLAENVTVTAAELSDALGVSFDTVRGALMSGGVYYAPDEVMSKTTRRGRPPRRWGYKRALDALESHYLERLSALKKRKGAG